ncbi:UNVERIFIED_CONTAM: hypothetical protein FKN15_000202 [Acipenser sinensis]
MAITKGLPSRYTATQMHLHWGGMNLEASGSEHTIDGMRYMAELHIVHYNSDKYASFAEAKDKADGLAVLAFIYEIRIMENALMDHRNKTLRNDYRHVQPLNDRVIEASFLPRFGALCRHEDIETKLAKIEQMIHDLGKQIRRALCRHEDIETKLAKIEQMIHDLGKQIRRGIIITTTPSPPTHPAQTYISPLAFHFTEKSFMSYAQVHLVHSMELRSFTACMHVKAGTTGVHTVLSYSGFQNDNELVISTGAEVGLWIGGHFVNFPLNHRSQEMLHYCITWASHSGGAELWVNGVVGEEKHVRRGYVLQSGGTFILGKDQDGILGISESDSFVGHMSDVNIWDYILSSSEIRELMKCSNVRSKGNVVGWGSHRVDLFGGVRLERDTRCG